MKKRKLKRKVIALIEFNTGEGYRKEYVVKTTLTELRKQIRKQVKKPIKRIKFLKGGK